MHIGVTTKGHKDVTTEITPKTSGTTLKKNSLGFLGIAFFLIAAAAPMGVFIGGSPVVFAMIGPQAPLLYLLVSGLVALFAVGYLRMSRHIPNAGGFVSYVARGLGDRAAGAVAGIVIVCYGSFMVGIYTQYTVFFTQFLSTTLGIDLPAWVCIVVTLVIITILSMRGVDLNMRVLTALLAFEFLVIAIFVIGILIARPGQDPSLTSFDPTQLAQPALGVAIIFVFGAFAGFEATAVFAEEAREPRKTIPRALYFLVFFMAAFFAVSTWAVSYGIGPDAVRDAAAENLAGVMFDLAGATAGEWLAVLMQIMVIVSFLAMLLGFQNLFLRYLFTLGRAEFLPKRLSTLSRAQSPSIAAFVIALVLGAILLAAYATGADPMGVIFAWSISLGSVSFVTAMTITGVAIVAFFFRERRERGMWGTRIAPITAAVLTMIVLFLSVSNYDSLLGASDAAAWLTLLAIPIAMVAGWVRVTVRPTTDFRYEAIM